MEGLLFVFPDSSRFKMIAAKFDDGLFRFFIFFNVCVTDKSICLQWTLSLINLLFSHRRRQLNHSNIPAHSQQCSIKFTFSSVTASTPSQIKDANKDQRYSLMMNSRSGKALKKNCNESSTTIDS